jgi:hypothetical protein
MLRSARRKRGRFGRGRLFTCQTRDLSNNAYYFFKSRYCDTTIGKFHTLDTVVPAARIPRG